MRIPRQVDDLTPEWLGAALGRPVTAVAAEPLGVGVGLVGSLFRLTLDGPGAGGATLVAKLAAPTDEGRFVPTVLNMYGREVGFYTELAASTPIPHPACLYAAHDPATQDCVLLLEDVSARGEILDQVAGCTIERGASALRTLARLHARFWGDPSLGDHAFLLRLCDDPYPGAVAFAYETAWPRVQQFFPEQIDARLARFGDEYAKRIGPLFAKLCEGPLVLSHSDWRLDNLVFMPGGDVLALDWQLVDRSVGPRDLAYFVTQSMTIIDPGDYRRAFDTYVGELRARGVDVDDAWAWEMYRYGALLGFVYPVVAAGALAIDDPRHLTLTGTLMARSVAALDALDAFDLPL